jgi:hypothetical protein
MQEVHVMLAEDQVNCPRLVQLLDGLANAPHYEEMNQPLWNRRGQPGLEGRLWNIRDAYEDGVNQFNPGLGTFRSIRDTCAAGTQPRMDFTSPIRWTEHAIGKMEHVIHEIEPVIGP